MPHLLFDAENILYMMTQFVRDDIGLCELRITAAEAL